MISHLILHDADKTSGIVCITQSTPKVEPRSDSMRLAHSHPPMDAAGSQETQVLDFKYREEEPSPDSQGDEQRKEDVAEVEEMKREDESKGFNHQEDMESCGHTEEATIGPVSVQEFADHVKIMKDDSTSFDDEWAVSYLQLRINRMKGHISSK